MQSSGQLGVRFIVTRGCALRSLLPTPPQFPSSPPPLLLEPMPLASVALSVHPRLILSLISVSPPLACTRGCPQHPRSPGVQCKVLLSCPSVFLLCRTSLSGQVGTSAELSRTFPAAVARPPTVCVHECPLPKVRAKNYPGIEGAAV